MFHYAERHGASVCFICLKRADWPFAEFGVHRQSPRHKHGFKAIREGKILKIASPYFLSWTSQTLPEFHCVKSRFKIRRRETKRTEYTDFS